MPPAQLGCAYLNFTASHDGIGMRPAEGLLPPEDIAAMTDTARQFGGDASMRALDGAEAVYELNITWFEALKGTFGGEDAHQLDRVLTSQTIVMALEGIPAFYVHTLLATPNDHDKVARTGMKRAINRHHWDYGDLQERLTDPDSLQSRMLAALKARIDLRGKQPAFHPNATQFTLQTDDRVFGVWRQSLDRDQSIFALHNVSKDDVDLDPVMLNLIDGDSWFDILTGERIETSDGTIPFAPYQCRWITNRHHP